MFITIEKQAEIAFTIINASATSKNLALESVNFAKEKQFDKAIDMIEQARNALATGSKAHGKLIQEEASGNAFQISLLLMHSEDQMLNTETIIIMAEQLCSVYKTLYTKD